MRARLADVGIRVVQTPVEAPNANAYAGRFVRSIKQECLHRVIPFGERHFRRTIAEHADTIIVSAITKGLNTNRSTLLPASQENIGRMHRRPRLGGLLNYYSCAA